MKFDVVCHFEEGNNETSVTVPSEVQSNPNDYCVALAACNLLFTKSTKFKPIPVLLNAVEQTAFVEGRWEPVLTFLNLSLTKGRLTEDFDFPQYHRLLFGNDLIVKVLPHVFSGYVILRFSKF